MKSDVDRIKERLSIVDVVSPYVKLKPAGSRLKGLSPFKQEKTPSFFVSPEQGYYHCFSTDQGGDIFSFVQSIEGLDFSGALKFLAEKAGIELTNSYSKQNRDEKTKIYDCLEAAQEFFVGRFNQATVAKSFTDRRGISQSMVELFTIGYAPDDWRQLYDVLSKKFDDDTLLQAGLIKVKNNSTYDLFRDRVMFPIRDIAGRTVGFSGRRLDDENIAKYLNSPESPVFKKSQVLFGFYEGRQSIRQLDFTIIVEGQIDLVLAHQAGSTNAVASSGTAFTAKHLQIIKRYSDNVLLALDSDSAGIKAAVKIAEAAYREGMTVKSIVLADDSDPADVISDSIEKWHQLIKESISLPELLTRKAKKTARNETNFITTLRKVIIPLVSLITSPIERNTELQKIAAASDVPATVLESELKSVQVANKKQYSSVAEAALVNPGPVKSRVKLDSKEKILASLADKVTILQQHFPEIIIPVLPVPISDLPQPDTANLLGRDIKGDKQIVREIKQLIFDYHLLLKSEQIQAQLTILESKPEKNISDINEINQLRKKLEDLLNLSI